MRSSATDAHRAGPCSMSRRRRGAGGGGTYIVSPHTDPDWSARWPSAVSPACPGLHRDRGADGLRAGATLVKFSLPRRSGRAICAICWAAAPDPVCRPAASRSITPRPSSRRGLGARHRSALVDGPIVAEGRFDELTRRAAVSSPPLPPPGNHEHAALDVVTSARR